MENIKNDCTVRLDRLRMAAEFFPKSELRNLHEFRCIYDYATKANGPKPPSYGRVCRYVNVATGSQIEGQYMRVQGWLPKATITLVANDRTGLLRVEVDAVMDLLEGARLVLVELALDFNAGSIVDSQFVKRHLLAGKARHRSSPRYPGFDWFGTKRSPKFVRSYEKKLS